MKAQFRRNIRDGKDWDSCFGKPQGTRQTIMAEAAPQDTAKEMRRLVYETLNQTEKVAERLKADTDEKTCRNIFDFIYNHIQYGEDSEQAEEIHEPFATWAKRFVGVDCDDMAILAASLCLNCGIPCSFRIAAYGVNRKTKEFEYSHVYVIAGKGYVIDPVLDKFDKEEPYLAKLDYAMRLDRLGKPKVQTTKSLKGGEDILSSVLSIAGQQIDKVNTNNGTSAGGQTLSVATEMASKAVGQVKKDGGKVDWQKITGICLSVGLAAVAQCFGIPAPVGAAIGAIINKIIWWVVSLFKKEPKIPSGWKFDPEKAEHKLWLNYVIDTFLLFNRWYVFKFAKEQKWDKNVLDGREKRPVKEVFPNFEAFLYSEMIWMTKEYKSLTPLNSDNSGKDSPVSNEGISALDFEDWSKKTGRWSVISMWWTYCRDRCMIIDFELFKKMVSEANSKKISFSQHFQNYVQTKLWESWEAGAIYVPQLDDKEGFGSYLKAGRAIVPGGWDGDMDLDFRFYPYLAPMRTPYNSQWAMDLTDLNTFYFIAFRYDRIMKLDPKGPFGIAGKDGYVAEAKKRNKSVFYVIAQYIGWALDDEASKGKKTDFKQWVQLNQKDLDNWRNGKDVWAGKKCTKMVITKQGQIFLYDTGEFENPDTFEPIQEQWSVEISQPTPPEVIAAAQAQAAASNLPEPPKESTANDDAPTKSDGVLTKIKNFAKENPLATGAIVVTAGLATAYSLGAFKPKVPSKGKIPQKAPVKGLNGLNGKQKKTPVKRETKFVKNENDKKVLIVKLA